MPSNPTPSSKNAMLERSRTDAKGVNRKKQTFTSFNPSPTLRSYANPVPQHHLSSVYYIPSA